MGIDDQKKIKNQKYQLRMLLTRLDTTKLPYLMQLNVWHNRN